MFCKICQSEVDYDRMDKFIQFHVLKLHHISSQEYYDKFIKKSGEGICEVCQKPTRFVNISKGYSKCCSIKCYHNNKKSSERRKRTNLQKYGTICNLQNESCQEKGKQTCLEKYGVDNIHKSDIIKNKRKQTCIELYGAETPFESSNIQKKINENVKMKYGVDSTLLLPEVIEKTNKTSKEKYGYICNFSDNDFKHLVEKIICDKYQVKSTLALKEVHDKTIKNARNNTIKEFEAILSQKQYKLIEYGEILSLICNKGHIFNISRQQFFRRLKANFDICTECNPLDGYSNTEKQLLNFIKENYSKQIIENSKKVIPPLELDIYIPELKLAFEYNGLFWHNELNKNDNYHLNKTLECEKLGIHLVQIYEDDWNFKQDIVKSRILNLLGKSQTIFGRKCKIQNVSSKDSADFLEQNHIQGHCNSKINLGLYYEGNLVSLMTFGKLRKNLGQKAQDGSFELLRFCNKINISVIGGANKLWQYFMKSYNPKEVISYADRFWTMKNGNTLYDKLGFEFVNETKPNYYYVVEGTRKNRFNYRKDILIKEGFDANKTEHQIMLERKIYRIYNSGTLKYRFRTKES